MLVRLESPHSAASEVPTDRVRAGWRGCEIGGDLESWLCWHHIWIRPEEALPVEVDHVVVECVVLYRLRLSRILAALLPVSQLFPASFRAAFPVARGTKRTASVSGGRPLAVPEGHRKFAGGRARHERTPPDHVHIEGCAPEGAPEMARKTRVSSAPAGAHVFLQRSGGSHDRITSDNTSTPGAAEFGRFPAPPSGRNSFFKRDPVVSPPANFHSPSG